ncbi:cytochrome c biogenesis protein ResB [Chlorobium sp. N1]|uniref:cytochrome c biogenesis protein ResB n=1 Tax=Chlorobium sp. N1 TaxID=2491138 RepID=UPI0010405BA3|nr:cytochrome c biogenesis protein ResB [Chlorobium sp. N1]TCD48701.1 cytochrome c biogenesis protein [Chlorobium sp. N1]
MTAKGRTWFQAPWQYRESALTAITATAFGFAVQYTLKGTGIDMPQWPLNGVSLALLALATLTIALAFRRRPFVQWLGGIPLGLSLIIALALISFIGGMVPQGIEGSPLALRLGLHAVFSSWPFALIVGLFLLNIGLSLVWRTVPFNIGNLQFILFHGGFWLALACGVFGRSDLERLIVPVYEGRSSSHGMISGEGRELRRLPFSIHLHDFSIEEYPPEILLYDPAADRFIMDESQTMTEIRRGVALTWKGTRVEILDYLPSAMPGADGTPVAAPTAAGIPYAMVRITGTGAQPDTWISTGGPGMRPYAAEVGSRYLIMMPGSPKTYRSAVTIRGLDGSSREALLEVNKPVNFAGWKIYQMGYDEASGRFSTLSLLEAIRDPWLPAVYLGLFMILGGNALFFWNGIKRSGVER